MIEKRCLRRYVVSERVWERKGTVCEKVGRVQCARGWYDQEDRWFISNMISLRQVTTRLCRYKGTSKKGPDKERTNEERGIRWRGMISILTGYLGERHRLSFYFLCM